MSLKSYRSFKIGLSLPTKHEKTKLELNIKKRLRQLSGLG